MGRSKLWKQDGNFFEFLQEITHAKRCGSHGVTASRRLRGGGTCALDFLRSSTCPAYVSVRFSHRFSVTVDGGPGGLPTYDDGAGV